MWQRPSVLTTRISRAPQCAVLSAVITVFALPSALAGVHTYTQEGHIGGTEPTASSAPPASTAQVSSSSTDESPLIASISIHALDGQGDSVDQATGIGASWITPRTVAVDNGTVSLVVRVGTGAERVRNVTFIFDGPVRSGATTSTHHVVDQTLVLESTGAGDAEVHFVLDVELLNLAPRRVSAVLALDGDQTTRLADTRLITHRSTARSEGQPIFLWCASGEFGAKMDLTNLPVERGAIIIYEHQFGIYPRFWEGNKQFGGVPQSISIPAHIAKARRDLREKIPDPNWSGYAVLDFESWFAGWEWCPSEMREESIRLVREEHPDLDEDQLERMAIEAFEHAAEDYLLQTLRMCKL